MIESFLNSCFAKPIKQFEYNTPDNGSDTWNSGCKSGRNDHQNVLKPSCDLADCFLIYGDMRAPDAYKLPALERSIGLERQFRKVIWEKVKSDVCSICAVICLNGGLFKFANGKDFRRFVFL